MKFNEFLNQKLSVTTTCSHFEAQSGDEYMLQFTIVDTSLTFDEQLSSLLTEIKNQCDAIDGAQVIFRRFFVSDAANQITPLLEGLKSLSDCATSIVEQAPLNKTKISAWVYMQSGVEMTALEDGLYCVKQGDYSHYWAGTAITRQGNSHQQMKVLFDQYIASLEAQGCNLADNCIRTWLFVQNVDVNYAGVVTGRNEIFDQQNLTTKTHFISSTGIQGRHADHNVLVQMDSYAVKGIDSSQIQFLYAPTHLCSTYDYGVSFERGTAVHYDDRSYAYISGTASIDNKGDVLYIGDIRRQTQRMWENVEVLLAEAKCTFDDMAHVIVYLRDMADYDIVKEMFDERFPFTPKVFVLAPVCRPTWLIEMECIAIRKN